ncbi:hypothetical protein D3C72_2588460 [compost metagenome]
MRAAIGDLQHLVDLFLVFNDGDADFGILQDIQHFLRDGILIQRNRYGPESLRGHHGQV